jgi:hypothetical protein
MCSTQPARPGHCRHRGKLHKKGPRVITKQVRVSIYIQILLAILISLVAPTYVSRKPLFRNAIVTVYAMFIALQFAHREQGYSQQQYMVVCILAYGLGGSAWPTMLLQSSLLLTRYDLLVFGAMEIFGTVILVKLLLADDCYDFSVPTTRAGRILFALALSLGLLLVSITALYSRVLTGHRKNLAKNCLIVIWILFCLFTIIGAEVNMAIYVYIRQDGQAETLNTTNWGLGQVMAMVMLLSQLGEIGASFIERSTFATDKFVARTWHRIRYPVRGRSSTDIHTSSGRAFDNLDDSVERGLEHVTTQAQESEGRSVNGGGNLSRPSEGQMGSGSDLRRDVGVQVSCTNRNGRGAILVDVTTQTDENMAILVDVTTQTQADENICPPQIHNTA